MILLLRHGEIARPAPKAFVGRADLPLNDLGVRQAQYWGDWLADRPLSKIHASDLSRTRETTRLILERRARSERSGVVPAPSVRFDPALREIDLGAWEGLTPDEVRRRYPGQWEARGRDLAAFRPPGGESFADLAARIVPVFEALAPSSPGGTGDVLLVAHAGVIRVILCHVLGLPLADLMRLGQGYGAMNLVERGPRGYVLHGLNLRPDA